MRTAEDTTRSRLLDAAEEAFGERGYDAVGIREIADRAGVNLSGIKYHFGSKRGLYIETVRRAMDRRGSSAAWAILRRSPSDPAEAATLLRAFVQAFLGVLLDDKDACCTCLVMHSAIEPGDTTDLVVSEFIRPHHDQLVSLITALRPDASARERSRYAELIMGQILHQRVFREFIDRIDPAALRARGAIDALADQITSFSLRGMGCAPALVDQIMNQRPVGAGERS